MAVDLEFGSFGKPGNPPLIILHGLLGSSRNWMSVGQKFADFFNVFVIDLRNHGISPHTPTHSYEEMIEDVEHWVSSKQIGPFYLLGHSMGGKVAMGYACRHPERVKGLIIEDIAPKIYSHRWGEEFRAMEELNLSLIKSGKDADKALEPKITDWGMRQFIMTNLVRSSDREFYWKINLPVLVANLENILGKAVRDDDKFKGPALFLRGAKSDYIAENDDLVIKSYFPNSMLIDIADAGHNAHIENMHGFIEALMKFVNELESAE